jgi:hypothetical protein
VDPAQAIPRERQPRARRTSATRLATSDTSSRTPHREYLTRSAMACVGCWLYVPEVDCLSSQGNPVSRVPMWTSQRSGSDRGSSWAPSRNLWTNAISSQANSAMALSRYTFRSPPKEAHPRPQSAKLTVSVSGMYRGIKRRRPEAHRAVAAAGVGCLATERQQVRNLSLRSSTGPRITRRPSRRARTSVRPEKPHSSGRRTRRYGELREAS